MADRYVDPAAAGANNGTSWGDAWTDINSAFAAPVAAGDFVYCRGTQTRTAAQGTCTTTVAGTIAAGARIIYIGCDAAGVARAGQFTIQGVVGDLPATLLTVNTATLTFENFTMDGSSGLAVDVTAGGDHARFIHCLVQNAGAAGLDAVGALWNEYYRCQFLNNTTIGLTASDAIADRLFVSGSGTYGVVINTGNITLCDSGIYDSADDNVRVLSSARNLIIRGNNIDDSAAGSAIYVSDQTVYMSIMWNRLTNYDQYGIEVVATADTRNFEDFNAFDTLVTGVAQRLNILAGENSVTLTADGYEAVGNLTLTDTAEQRRVEQLLEW